MEWVTRDTRDAMRETAGRSQFMAVAVRGGGEGLSMRDGLIAMTSA